MVRDEQKHRNYDCKRILTYAAIKNYVIAVKNMIFCCTKIGVPHETAVFDSFSNSIFTMLTIDVMMVVTLPNCVLFALSEYIFRFSFR
jgi:hypothetical protein